MEKIVVHKVYNLVNPNGDKLQLKLGWIKDCTLYGWRWSFEGKKIPMPVRSCTWFNGFPEPVMLEWLKANGWAVRTIVHPCDGSAEVFDLPQAPNATENRHGLDEHTFEICKNGFNEAMRYLVTNGKRLAAVRVYRYANGGSLGEAVHAINDICNA